jgi:hypothetical protein
VEGPNSIAAKGTLSGMIACPTDGVDVFAQFNGKAVYKDFVQSYSTVEPPIDLTASSFLAFSWQIAGAPSGVPITLWNRGAAPLPDFILAVWLQLNSRTEFAGRRDPKIA